VTRIAYLVHNLADAAVARRVTMLRAAGAEVSVAGFCRDATPPAEVSGARALSLGRTHDGALRQRAQQVIANRLRPARLLDAVAGADVIVARNLEMLVLAGFAKRRARVPRLVYESLDIHRALLGSGPTRRVMRAIERALMRRADLLLSSSPAFLREYFVPLQRLAIPSLLVENKLLWLDGAPPVPVTPPPSPPWRIGWFGNLRCARTLETLAELAQRAGGAIEILIAGKASPAEFPDFARQVARPHLHYHGPYTPAELPDLYGRCHFAWAIDYFEEGLNSSWLLPNRLYEAASAGAVPIALETVETGRWLAGHGAGMLLRPGEERAGLLERLTTLGPAAYDAMRARVAAIPRTDVIADLDDCRALLRAVAG
jgi:glycosyltransferase involved in cell wall biosynthesis